MAKAKRGIKKRRAPAKSHSKKVVRRPRKRAAGAFLANSVPACLKKLTEINRAGKLLGSGQEGSVREACTSRAKASCNKYVAKFQLLGKTVTASDKAKLTNEVRMQERIAALGMAGKVKAAFFCKVGAKNVHIILMQRLAPVVGKQFTGAALNRFWDGLQKVHRAGLFHLDLFEGNVLSKGNNILLSDFGFSRQIRSPRERPKRRSEDVREAIDMFTEARLPVPRRVLSRLIPSDQRAVAKLNPDIRDIIKASEKFRWRARA